MKCSIDQVLLKLRLTVIDNMYESAKLLAKNDPQYYFDNRDKIELCLAYNLGVSNFDELDRELYYSIRKNIKTMQFGTEPMDYIDLSKFDTFFKAVDVMKEIFTPFEVEK